MAELHGQTPAGGEHQINVCTDSAGRPDYYLHLALEGTAGDGIHPGSQYYLFTAYFIPISDRGRYWLVWGFPNLPRRKTLKLVSEPKRVLININY